MNNGREITANGIAAEAANFSRAYRYADSDIAAVPVAAVRTQSYTLTNGKAMSNKKF